MSISLSHLTRQKPLIIAGPCSAESETQILTTARSLSKVPEVDFFRAGVWKPRTQPGDFEGFGEEGLRWLQRAKAETGLPIATEVANAAHVDLAMHYEIDLLWIGARTTANPFSVTEIARALQGTALPVLVKNPIHPDPKLWMGAIERLFDAGITNVAAVHRGFSGFHLSECRNEPFWELVFDLKRQFPTLPVLCDPSHLCGKTELIPAYCQKSIDLEMNGLMVEVHHQPEQAKTDARQQLTPADFEQMLHTLVYHTAHTSEKSFLLERYRNEIDILDSELIEILARRLAIVRQIGALKKENNWSILQLNRWKEVVNHRLQSGIAKGIDEEFLTSILQSIHKESIKIQTEIFEGKPTSRKDEVFD